MSIEIIGSQITQFLERDAAEILAIKGAWGVGKTYTWDQYLSKASQEESLSKKKYAYVSLFGMSSLEDFKYSIFENSIDCNVIGKRITLDTLTENTVRCKSWSIWEIYLLYSTGNLKEVFVLCIMKKQTQ